MKVFVYGTLKPGEGNYQPFCEGKTIQEKRAYVLGQLFHLPFGYPAMTTGDTRVEGFLLEFADPAILQRLDWLESYDPNRSLEENHYYRQEVMVYAFSEEPIGSAWAYLMNSEKVKQYGGVFLPSGIWSGE